MRIAGVDIPDNKKITYARRYIYGIGPKRAQDIVDRSGVDPDIRTKDLSEDETSRIRDALERGGYLIEGDLKREIAMNIRRLVEIGAYRGVRHRTGLPVHGQRTRTNARGRKGVRKTVSRGGRRV